MPRSAAITLPTGPEPAGEGAPSPRRYASPVMLDRRRRILAEAQRLLDEHGVEGFTIRELSARAEVAQRTLYNVFGSKEEIIAAAIDQHFRGLLADAPAPPAATDFEGLLARSAQIADFVINLRRYASAMVGVFFSPLGDARIHDSLVRISMYGGGDWIGRAEAAGVLVPLSVRARDAMLALLINGAYANVGDLTTGRIGEAEFRRRSQSHVLLVCHAYLRPANRRTATDLLERLLGQP